MKVRQGTGEEAVPGAFLLGNLLTSLGILLTASGGGWDISNHLLGRPETFFSPPHAVMYAGVAVALAGTVMAFFRWHGFAAGQKSRYGLPVRMGAVGILVLASAGPVDFAWHSSFGLDGLLSPPHLVLVSGMFLCCVSSMVSILRTGRIGAGGHAARCFLVTAALLPVWMVASGYVYSFSLPFSRTEYFDFNPDPGLAAVFVTIASPFVISSVLILGSRLVGFRFGALTILGCALLAINAANSIMPNPWLWPATLPFYLATVIPIVAADALLASSQGRAAVAGAGAVLGSVFYFLYFPLITHVYNQTVHERLVSASVTAHVYSEMVPEVFPVIVVPAAAMGIAGSVFSGILAKRILSQG